MKSKWLAGAWGLLGFVVGALLGPKVSGGAAASSNESSGATAVAGNSSVRQEGHTRDSESRPTRAGADRIEAAKKSAEPRVSIPVKEIARVISAHAGSLHWFQSQVVAGIQSYDPSRFHEVLCLLEASESERETVHVILQKMLKEIQDAESRHLKAVQANPSEIILDFSEVAHVVNEIFAEAQDDLRLALPEERGEALAIGISSQSLYMYGKSDVLRLSIERRRSGSPMIMIRHATGGGSGSGLRVDLFPDDGTPIPADQVFGKRWQASLSGMTLLPVDEK